MFHQQTQETESCHDDHIVITLFAVVTGQQEFRVILVYWDLKHTTDIQIEGLNRELPHGLDSNTLLQHPQASPVRH